MFRRAFFGLLATFALAGSVHAATISDPSVDILYDPTLPLLIASGDNLTATPPITPAPAFALLIDTTGTVQLTVQDDAFNTILFATGTVLTPVANGITSLLQTTTDVTGLFGPSVRVSLLGFDPAQAFEGTGSLLIESVPEVIPLPAGAPLLVGGLALLWGMRRRSATA